MTAIEPVATPPPSTPRADSLPLFCLIVAILLGLLAWYESQTEIVAKNSLQPFDGTVVKVAMRRRGGIVLALRNQDGREVFVLPIDNHYHREDILSLQPGEHVSALYSRSLFLWQLRRGQTSAFDYEETLRLLAPRDALARSDAPIVAAIAFGLFLLAIGLRKRQGAWIDTKDRQDKTRHVEVPAPDAARWSRKDRGL